jgi:branched-chain amino acid transport system substrate-binding protein
MRFLKWIVGAALIIAVVTAGLFLGRPKGDILIGAVLPVTGEYGPFGASVARGIGLATEELNAEGGVHGRMLVVDVEDSGASPELGRAIAERLITEKGVEAIIGAMSSDVTLAIAPLAEANQTVLLSPASSSPAITHAGDFVFRNYPSETLQSELIVGYAFEQSCRRAAILTVQDDDGIRLSEAFRLTVRNLGGEVVYNERFLPSTRVFNERLERLVEAAPECVFIVGHNRQLRAIVAQARALGLEAIFYSPVIFHDDQTVAAGGGSVQGVVFSAPAFDRESSTPHIEEFSQAFEERFKGEPDIWAAHGHDALHLLVEAMRSHGTTGTEIRDGLYEVDRYQGIAGETSFDANGDVRRPGRFITVKDGAFVILEE